MRNLFLFLMALCVMSFSGVATATESGLPLLKPPPAGRSAWTSTEIASAIRNNDRAVLNATPEQYRGHFSSHRGMTFGSDEELAVYVENLSPEPITGRWSMSILPRKGGYASWVRNARPGEVGLCDRNLSSPDCVVMSASCGNVAKPIEHHAPPAPQAPNIPVAMVACSWCGLANQPLQFAPPLNPALFTEQVKQCESGTPCHEIMDTVRTIIIGGAMVGTGAVLPASRTVVNQTVNGAQRVIGPRPVPPVGGPVNPPEYPPSGGPTNPPGYPPSGGPANPSDYWQ